MLLQSFPKRVRNQQDAIWELISTEVSYLRTLKVITEASALCRLVARSTVGLRPDVTAFFLAAVPGVPL